jgi:hypothetical protein
MFVVNLKFLMIKKKMEAVGRRPYTRMTPLSVSEYEIGKKSGSFTHLHEMCTACILIHKATPTTSMSGDVSFCFRWVGVGGGGG